MSLYDNMAATALKQIKEKGRNVTLKTPSSGQVYDPATDTFTAGTDDEETVKALFTQFAKKDVDGTNILRTDMRVLIAAASLEDAPSTNNKILDGSTEYRVVNTETVKPGNTPILYMVQVRR